MENGSSGYRAPQAYDEDLHIEAVGGILAFIHLSPDFFDVGIKLSCHFHLSKTTELEVNGGVKNILDSFHKDLDAGQMKDAAYVYGPSFPRMAFLCMKLSI
ncbi:MAG: hypothetical protein LBB85_07070 [Dysgonamonadaceae bacterium]|jgi:hypothetical protein|nr:hypothetical protein [Dysgonamonadaceae bacterium]